MQSLLNQKSVFRDKTIPTKDKVIDDKLNAIKMDRENREKLYNQIHNSGIKNTDPLSYDSRKNALYRKSFG